MVKKMKEKINKWALKAHIAKLSMKSQKGEIPYWVNVGVVILIVIALGVIIFTFAGETFLNELQKSIMGLWDKITS